MIKRYILVEIQVGPDGDPEELPNICDWGAYNRIVTRIEHLGGQIFDSATHVSKVLELSDNKGIIVL